VAESGNTLAYYDSESNMPVKVFIVKAAEMKKSQWMQKFNWKWLLQKDNIFCNAWVNSTKTIYC